MRAAAAIVFCVTMFGVGALIAYATTSTKRTVTVRAATVSYVCMAGQTASDVGPTDVCLTANTYIVDAWRGLQDSTLYKTWAKANPGEVSRFTSYLAVPPPSPWDPTFPATVRMKTVFGAFLRDLVSTCKILLCPAQIFPTAPPVSAYPDTTAPQQGHPMTIIAQPAPVTSTDGTVTTGPAQTTVLP